MSRCRRHALIAVGAVIALASSCSRTTVTHTQRQTSMPNAGGTTSTTAGAASSTTAASSGSIGLVTLDRIPIEIGCLQPPAAIVVDGNNKDVTRRDAPIYAPVFTSGAASGSDAAVVVYRCGIAEGVTVAWLDASSPTKVASAALPLGVLAPTEHAFVRRPVGDDKVIVDIAQVTDSALQNWADHRESTDATTTSDSPTTTSAAGPPTTIAGPAADLPDGAITTKTVTFTWDGSSFVASGSTTPTTADPAASGWNLTPEGLGPWRFGTPRDTVVKGLLERDPSATVETGPPCLSGLGEVVRAGDLFVAFHNGVFGGVWIDTTFGRGTPVPIDVNGVPLDGLTVKTVKSAPGTTGQITTESDGTKIIGLSAGKAPLWAVADVDGFIIGVGVAGSACIVNG